MLFFHAPPFSFSQVKYTILIKIIQPHLTIFVIFFSSEFMVWLSMEILKRERPRARRNGFTIPNPFVSENLNIVDMDNLTDEQKTYKIKKHDWTFIRQPEYVGLFIFVHVQYDRNQVKDDDTTKETVIAERAFFKDYESAKEFFRLVRDQDFIDYFCFQYEKGEKRGLLHLQGFMRYKKEMDMKQVHRFFPTIHLDPSYGTNHECRDYCMKSQTAIESDEHGEYGFYEYGNFVEIRQRTDLNGLIDDIIANLPYEEMLRKYPHQMINMGDKIEKTRQNILRDRFKNTERQIHVMYLYGAEGTGKTTFVNRVLGRQFMEVFKVSNYKHSGKFDNYASQDIILFDEWQGQIEITEMNDMLNGQPYNLPCRFNDRVACFTTVVFASNYPIEQAYKGELDKGKYPSYKGFLRRVNEIIYMPKQNHYVWEKGQPSEQVLAKLTEQNATVTIKEQPIEQTTIKGVQA